MRNLRGQPNQLRRGERWAADVSVGARELRGRGWVGAFRCSQKPSELIVEPAGPQAFPEQLAGMMRSVVPWIVRTAIGLEGRRSKPMSGELQSGAMDAMRKPSRDCASW